MKRREKRVSRMYRLLRAAKVKMSIWTYFFKHQVLADPKRKALMIWKRFHGVTTEKTNCTLIHWERGHFFPKWPWQISFCGPGTGMKYEKWVMEHENPFGAFQPEKWGYLFRRSTFTGNFPGKGTNQRIVFHLPPNRNFRTFFLNGKCRLFVCVSRTFV